MWHQLTWIFLHSFAEKINEDMYIKNQGVCYNFLLNVYQHMHCNRCSIHSVIYLKKNKENLSTKDKLINYLFEFHNNVNIKLSKNVFEKDILEKYKCSNIDNIFMHYTSRMKPTQYIIDFLENNRSWFT